LSVVVAVELAVRSEELRALIDSLIRPTKRDLGDGRRGEVIPVLDAILDAYTARCEARVKVAAPKNTRLPIRLSAVELLHSVDKAVGGPRATCRLDRVRSWGERVIATGSLTAVEDACEFANYWSHVAENLLSPPKVLPIRGARCPSCGYATVVGPGDAGEDEIEPALAADLRTGVVSCAVDGCGASWPWDALESLADQLAVQTQVEVLAVE
jgi:hypothetical protein